MAGGDGQEELSAPSQPSEVQDEREGTESVDHGDVLRQSPVRWENTFQGEPNKHNPLQLLSENLLKCQYFGEKLMNIDNRISS